MLPVYPLHAAQRPRRRDAGSRNRLASLVAFHSSLATLLTLASVAGAQTLGGGPNSYATGAGHARAWQASIAPAPNFEVNLATGNVLFRFRTSSFRFGGLEPRHALDLFFNNQAKAKIGDYTGGFGLGKGWSSTCGSRLEFPTATTALLTRVDGDEIDFTLQGSIWQPELGSFLELESQAPNWIIRDRKQWEFTYDATGNLTKVTSASGNDYVLQWSSGRVIQTTEPSGRYLTLAYHASGRLASATDFVGAQWAFDYDGAGRLDEIDDPEYGTIGLTYDTSGRIGSYQDHDGNLWTFGYFDQGAFKHRVRRVTSVGGETFWVSYQDLFGSVETEVTDARDKLWRYVHDEDDSPRPRLPRLTLC